MFWPEDNPETSRVWRQRYLKLLGLEPAAPSRSALAALIRAQVLTVLFENVTALLRRRQHPVDPLPPLDPWALLVELEGRRWLVDAGCGAPIFEPIPLDRVTEVRSAGLAYRFRPAESGDAWLQERWINQEWTLFCRYVLDPAGALERDRAYRHHNTVGVSWVLGTVTLIRVEEERVLVARDGELAEHRATGKRTEPLSGRNRYRELVSQAFRLPGLPVEAGVEAWSALNRAVAPG